jgi:uroporphyrinogen decarboxylase
MEILLPLRRVMEMNDAGSNRALSPKERFFEVAFFGNPDKIPLSLWEIRPATLKRWWREGLPQGLTASKFFRFDVFGLNSVNVVSHPSEGFKWEPSDRAVNLGPMPPFEYRVLKEDERYRVWVDSLGVTQLGFQEDWRGGWSGFATRKFIDFPVKTREDFEKIRRRYDPNTPGRYPPKWSDMAKELNRRNGAYLVSITISGPFWWIRDMMGLEATLVSIFKDKKLIHDILELYVSFHSKVLEKCLGDVEVDYVILSEDMAYKRGPMISPRIFRDFFSAVYREITSFFREHGVKIILVDSDGNIEPIIPGLSAVGVNGISPCEVAAGMDVNMLRLKYPRLIMMGGIDKRRLASSKEDIKGEVDRISKAVWKKGYFPGVDHAVPPDVSFENFQYFLDLMKKACGWINSSLNGNQ